MDNWHSQEQVGWQFPGLKHTGSNEYALKESAWITVGNISVYVLRTDEGAQVKLCALDCEGEPKDDLDSAQARFSDADAIRKAHRII